MSVLIKIIRHLFPQLALNQLFHTHSLLDQRWVIHYLQAPLFRLDLLLPDLPSAPGHVYLSLPVNLTCLLSLNFASTCSLSACGLPGLPLWRLRPQSEHRLWSLTRPPDRHPFGLINIVDIVLNCSSLDLYSSWIHSHSHYIHRQKYWSFSQARFWENKPFFTSLSP